MEGMSWAPISSTRLTKARSLADLRSLLAWTWGVGARQGAMGRGGEGVAAAAGGETQTPGGQLSARVCSGGCAPLGRSTESLMILVASPPPSRSKGTWRLLAAWVTMPRRQAAWAAAASALRRKADTSRGAAKLLAAALARQSTSLLARQSVAESNVPLLSRAFPTAWCDLCAGIQTRLPELTSSSIWPSAAWAIMFQTRASGLSWCVALEVPAMAVERRAWQSVRMGGVNGQ